MDRLNILSLSAIALCLSVGAAVAQDAHTTRIEPRAFYGAMVTIEGGVRMFRPLPPTRHVIINPDGATPLALSFNETRVYKRSYSESRSHNTHHHNDDGRIGGRTHSNVHEHRY